MPLEQRHSEAFDIEEFVVLFRGALDRGDSLEDAYREAFRLTVSPQKEEIR